MLVRQIAKRKKLGDIVEIPLPNGEYAYARIYQEYLLGIYKGKYQSYADLPTDAEFFRFIRVYRSCRSKLQVVGSRPFRENENSWGPDQVVVNPLTRKVGLYHRGETISCTLEECKGLERCAVWDITHLTDMLMGDTKWDDAMLKPEDILF